MYYIYDSKNSTEIPAPFHRFITPIMLGDCEEGKQVHFSVHMTEWPKGGKVDDHIHEEAAEVMFCIAGHGKCWLEDEEFDFVPGSMILALPGVRHRIENHGDELLRAVCIFDPPITEEKLIGRAKSAVNDSQQ